MTKTKTALHDNASEWNNTANDFPKILTAKDFKEPKILEWVSDNYQSEKLKTFNDENVLETFYEFRETESGRRVIVRQYGKLKHEISKISESAFKSPLFLRIEFLGESTYTPKGSKKQQKVAEFSVSWKNA